MGNKIMTEFVNYINKTNLEEQTFDKSFDRLIQVYNLALKTVKNLIHDKRNKDLYLNQEFVKNRRLLWSSMYNDDNGQLELSIAYGRVLSYVKWYMDFIKNNNM